jgi:hypothetical protein
MTTTDFINPIEPLLADLRAKAAARRASERERTFEVTITEGIIVGDQQPTDGFAVTIKDHDDLDGAYHFDYSYDEDSAMDAIFSGDVEPIN